MLIGLKPLVLGDRIGDPAVAKLAPRLKFVPIESKYALR